MEVVEDGRQCSGQIAIPFVVVVTISEAQNPTKTISMSPLNCVVTQP
jgi:hypothetical protein